MAHWFQKQWQTITYWHMLLIPLSWLFGIVVFIRKKFYDIGLLSSVKLSVPVIIVGNISVGGTGKTPFVIWLVEQLKAAGYQPGVISRGYGGSAQQIMEVFARSNPTEVGDEPVVIAKRVNCPLFIGADRVAVGQALLAKHPNCDVLISDDGLQHYRLKRDVEIALINSIDSFGNQKLLPAGPLREKMSRLVTVDAVVDSANNIGQQKDKPITFGMCLKGDILLSTKDSAVQQRLDDFKNKQFVAIAGIGKPERFFNYLKSFGLHFKAYGFTDHHVYRQQDMLLFEGKTILMTEKDAVKCAQLSHDDAWYLPVSAEITEPFNHTVLSLIQQKLNKRRK
jgi:tetraacyldisaccharide 4'-kinase